MYVKVGDYPEEDLEFSDDEMWLNGNMFGNKLSLKIKVKLIYLFYLRNANDHFEVQRIICLLVLNYKLTKALSAICKI